LATENTEVTELKELGLREEVISVFSVTSVASENI